MRVLTNDELNEVSGAVGPLFVIFYASFCAGILFGGAKEAY